MTSPRKLVYFYQRRISQQFSKYTRRLLGLRYCIRLLTFTVKLFITVIIQAAAAFFQIAQYPAVSTLAPRDLWQDLISHTAARARFTPESCKTAVSYGALHSRTH